MQTTVPAEISQRITQARQALLRARNLYAAGKPREAVVALAEAQRATTIARSLVAVEELAR